MRLGLNRDSVAAFALALAVVLGTSASDAGGFVGAFGENDHGELCAGYVSRPEKAVATLVPTGPLKLTAASDGNDYFLAGGTLFGCGANAYGTEGIGTRDLGGPAPVPVHLPGDVTDISAHGWQAIALTADGRVWTWGSNAFGQIGNGSSTQGREVAGLAYPTPAPVAGLEHATRIEQGGPDDAAILADGDVLAWGGNFGREIKAARGEVLRPTRVAQLSGRGVVAVAGSGFARSGGDLFGLTRAGAVIATGTNALGDLGGAPSGGVVPLPPVREVQTADNSVFAVTTDGRLYAWGADGKEQLGFRARERCGFYMCARHPELVGTGVRQVCGGEGYALALETRGVVAFGFVGYADVRVYPGGLLPLRSPTAIVCGRYHALFDYEGSALPGVIEATGGPGSVTVSWRSSVQPHVWALQYRKATPDAAYSAIKTLPAAARSYTFRPLVPGTAYELVVKNPFWGTRTVQATPSPLASVRPTRPSVVVRRRPPSPPVPRRCAVRSRPNRC